MGPFPYPGNPEAASELLQRMRDGSAGTFGGLDEPVLLVVDLDLPGAGGALEVPATAPWVVAGVSTSGKVGGPDGGRDAFAGVDVAITEAPDPGRPWVMVDDLDSALETIRLAVGAAPAAAVTLAQVLRSGDPRSLDHDLVLESLAYSALQGGPEFARWLSARPPRSPPAPEEGVLRMDRSAERVSLTLDRPRFRNAYNRAMRDALCEALAMVCADPSIKEVRLDGTGEDFCSGGDLGEFGTSADPVTAHRVRITRSTARLLGLVADRVTAHLHGACVGAGIELPALARRVMATADTRLGLPEVSMGLIPGAGGTASLPRRIGRHRTAWLALTGQFIGAATALSWGLVDEIAG